MLSVEHLQASYGASRALFGVSLAVGSGEVVAMIGRNGMGKTTTIRAIMGLLPRTTGSIRFQGRAILGWPSHRIARLGLGLVPEGRQVFGALTVYENLVALARGNGDWTLERIWSLFPILQERSAQHARSLSGGEQQMLAIARALMTNPQLLILDEATEGLAPKIRQDIWRTLSVLKSTGLAILVVDKNIKALAEIADRHYVLEKGRVVWTGDSASLRQDWVKVQRHLTI